MLLDYHADWAAWSGQRVLSIKIKTGGEVRSTDSGDVQLLKVINLLAAFNPTSRVIDKAPWRKSIQKLCDTTVHPKAFSKKLIC